MHIVQQPHSLVLPAFDSFHSFCLFASPPPPFPSAISPPPFHLRRICSNPSPPSDLFIASVPARPCTPTYFDPSLLSHPRSRVIELPFLPLRPVPEGGEEGKRWPSESSQTELSRYCTVFDHATPMTLVPAGFWVGHWFDAFPSHNQKHFRVDHVSARSFRSFTHRKQFSATFPKTP